MTHDSEFPICIPDAHGHCPVCADEAIPGRVLALRPFNMALVEMPQAQQEVALDLIDDAQVGDQLLVHAGVAIAKIEAA